MKPIWQVVLTKEPTPGHFQDGWFPRGFYYKKDAQTLVDEVRRHGGDAKIVRTE